jgi:hypothetical protein
MDELMRQLTMVDRAWRDALRPVISKYMSESMLRRFSAGGAR